ncbi:MAG: O-antigen ligase family protein, partial [bacterium]|nr:O-antigen ligase family protein [bacterium]
IIICFSLLVAVLWQFEKGERRFTSAGIGEKGTAFTLRVTWLQQSLAAFSDTYGLGIGAGNIYRVLSRASPTLPTPHSHNLYVHVLSELGLVGGIIWAVILYSIIRNTARALKRKDISPNLIRMLPAFAGALVMLGIAALLDYGYYMSELWLYLALILASINLAIQPKVKKPSGPWSV